MPENRLAAVGVDEPAHRVEVRGGEGEEAPGRGNGARSREGRVARGAERRGTSHHAAQPGGVVEHVADHAARAGHAVEVRERLFDVGFRIGMPGITACQANAISALGGEGIGSGPEGGGHAEGMPDLLAEEGAEAGAGEGLDRVGDGGIHEIVVHEFGAHLGGQRPVAEAARGFVDGGGFGAKGFFVVGHAGAVGQGVFEGDVGGCVRVWDLPVEGNEGCEGSAPLDGGKKAIRGRGCGVGDRGLAVYQDGRGGGGERFGCACGEGFGCACGVEEGLWGDFLIGKRCQAIALGQSVTGTPFGGPRMFFWGVLCFGEGLRAVDDCYRKTWHMPLLEQLVYAPIKAFVERRPREHGGICIQGVSSAQGLGTDASTVFFEIFLTFPLPGVST